MAITLKRLYETTPQGELVAGVGGQPIVRGVEILDAGPVGRPQHFTSRLIEQGTAQGWLSLGRGQLVIHGTGGAVVYRIDRAPGSYCCHCQAPLEDDASGRAPREHLARTHPGAASPDPSNPAGYRKDNFLACTRVE